MVHKINLQTHAAFTYYRFRDGTIYQTGDPVQTYLKEQSMNELGFNLLPNPGNPSQPQVLQEQPDGTAITLDYLLGLPLFKTSIDKPVQLVAKNGLVELEWDPSTGRLWAYRGGKTVGRSMAGGMQLVSTVGELRKIARDYGGQPLDEPVFRTFTTNGTESYSARLGDGSERATEAGMAAALQHARVRGCSYADALEAVTGRKA